MARTQQTPGWNWWEEELEPPDVPGVQPVPTHGAGGVYYQAPQGSPSYSDAGASGRNILTPRPPTYHPPSAPVPPNWLTEYASYATDPGSSLAVTSPQQQRAHVQRQMLTEQRAQLQQQLQEALTYGNREMATYYSKQIGEIDQHLFAMDFPQEPEPLDEIAQLKREVERRKLLAQLEGGPGGTGGAGGGLTPYQQWQMSRGDDDTAFNRMHLEREWGRTLEQDAYARQQDELAMERWAQEQARLREHQQQQMELQRRNAMAGLASSMMQLQQSTAPYAKGPNQEFHHGFERGGAYEKLLNMGGATYDPQQYRAPTVRIDPEQQWAWAMGKMGG